METPMRNICIILTLLCSTVIMAAEDTPKLDPNLPRDAVVSMDAYAKAVAKIEDEAAHKVNAEREKLYLALDKASKAAATKGDADAIVAIKAEQKKLLAEADKATGTDATKSGIPAELVGTWDLSYSNGASRKITVAADGSVHVIMSSFEGTGFDYKLTEDEKTKKLIGTCDPVGRVEAYTMKAGKLSVEHWQAGGLYKAGTPAGLTANGNKAKDEPKK
jgi:hypothetical protein